MNPTTGYVTPDAGRSRPVSLDQLGDLSDPHPLPNEFEEAELSAFAPDAAMVAADVLIALSEALSPVDRESLLYLLRPGDQTLRQRSRVAAVSPATIRSRALLMRRSLRRALHTPPAGDPLEMDDSGDGGGFR